MKRIYFLVPDIDTAHKIVDELLLARIEEKRIHVLAREGTPLEDLPEAKMLQKSDFIPAAQRGLALGGTIGTLAGLVGVALAPGAAVIAGGVILGAALTGASIGAWASGMIGLSVGNSRLKQFEDAIGKGALLMMIDVPKNEVERITELVRLHHPDVEPEGTDPQIPAFP